jgi:hypothetical protein
MTDQHRRVPTSGRLAKASSRDVDAFLQRLEATPAVRPAGRGRLIFALDATASRQPTWDRAARIQSDMFTEAAALGGLDIQLVFYRGFAECKTTPWLDRADELQRRMGKVTCAGGETQIERILRHVLGEADRQQIQALVFVGDAMEENPDRLCRLAGELGLHGVPAFLFQEGDDRLAAATFAEIARLTRGAHCRFDGTSPHQLRDLLRAVAVYAAGGRKALIEYGNRTGGSVLLLTRQMGGE